MKSVYLFSGESDARKTSAVQKLISDFVDPAFEEFDLEKLDGDSAGAEEILSAAATLPFASERKVVVVARAERLSSDAQSRIAAFIPKLGEKSCLVLVSEEKALQAALAAAAKKHGEVVSFGKMRADALATLAQQTVRAHGKRAEPSALQMLVRSVQSGPAMLTKETEKLCVYVGERETITQADVLAVVAQPAEERVFPLIDAVAAGRADTAVDLLEETLSASAKADQELTKVLALLARHFRLLCQTRYVLDGARVRSLSQAPEEFRARMMSELNPLSMPDWQQRRLAEQARLFTEKELRSCLEQVLACELSVKGLGKHGGSPRLNLEMLILRLSHRARQ
ncbi:MAG: DNA polymerase III subunit delta [Armatimonadota bacterium]